MASAEDNRLAFVMIALKHAEFKVDWNAVAAEAGITLAGNAQRKFREITKAAGYAFTNGKVVDSDGAPVAKATPTKRKSPAKKGKATATAEEADQEASDGEGSEEATNESPAKKTKTRKTPAKKGKAVNVETTKDASNEEAGEDHNEAKQEVKEEVEGEV